MRLIIDAWAPNRVFADPPHVSLLTAEGLGAIEVEFGDGVDPESGLAADMLRLLTVYLGLGDVDNAFHRLLMPNWMSP